MYRLIIPLCVVLTMFLICIPIFEAVTDLEEVVLIFMIWATIMVLYTSIRSWRKGIIQVKTYITMDEILDRYPQYRVPRTRHRL